MSRGRRSGHLSPRRSPDRSGADFTIGVPRSEYDRVSNVVPPPPANLDLSRLPPGHPALRTFAPVPMDATVTYTDAWREAEIGAANGFGNARSVTRIQSVITNGGEVDGVRLLHQKTIDRIFEVQSDGLDLVLLQPLQVRDRVSDCRRSRSRGCPIVESRTGVDGVARSCSTTSIAGSRSRTS